MTQKLINFFRLFLALRKTFEIFLLMYFYIFKYCSFE